MGAAKTETCVRKRMHKGVLCGRMQEYGTQRRGEERRVIVIPHSHCDETVCDVGSTSARFNRCVERGGGG